MLRFCKWIGMGACGLLIASPLLYVLLTWLLSSGGLSDVNLISFLWFIGVAIFGVSGLLPRCLRRRRRYF